MEFTTRENKEPEDLLGLSGENELLNDYIKSLLEIK